MSQFQLITDLLQNIYGRIAQLGQSINSLKTSLEDLNSTLGAKITTLVDTIKSMTDNVDKEGQEIQLIFKEIGNNALGEIKKLQEKIGLKDLDELLEKLNKITDSSVEALKPETVDVLLHEVLTAVKQLKGGDEESIDGEEEEILDKVGASLSKSSSVESTGTSSSSNNEKSTEGVSPGNPPPGNPPPGNPPPGNPPPGNPPPGNPPPGNPPPGNPPPI